MNTQDNNMKERRSAIEKDIIQYTSLKIREILEKIDSNWMRDIEEIRLRANKPLMLENRFGDWFISKDGKYSIDCRNPFIVTQDEIIRTLELMSENSIYAFMEEIKNGFVTIKGGHRVGIAGRIVLEGNSIRNIRDVSGLNIRLSKEVHGCSRAVLKYILNRGDIFNTLVISPPQCGKTTILRDITRLLSDGIESLNFKGIKVGVIDERSEIAACYKGVAQNQVGIRTDVLDGCPKAIGMIMMVRSLSPQVIVTDEIGNQGDKDAVIKILNSGVKIITSAHGYNISELKTRQEVIGLINEKVFERYIVLSKADGPGTVEEVIDGMSMDILYRRVKLCC